MQPLEPSALLTRVQLAARCGVRLVLVPPRRLLTVDGRNPGIFSADSARRLIDQYARVLPPDSLRKYCDVILGLNLADDYGCLDCWGGRAIRQSGVGAEGGYEGGRGVLDEEESGSHLCTSGWTLGVHEWAWGHALEVGEVASRGFGLRGTTDKLAFLTT